MCKMLNMYYQVSIFVLNSSMPMTMPTMSWKTVTRKEEPLNLNFEDPSEVKSLAYPVSMC